MFYDDDKAIKTIRKAEEQIAKYIKSKHSQSFLKKITEELLPLDLIKDMIRAESGHYPKEMDHISFRGFTEDIFTFRRIDATNLEPNMKRDKWYSQMLKQIHQCYIEMESPEGIDRVLMLPYFEYKGKIYSIEELNKKINIGFNYFYHSGISKTTETEDGITINKKSPIETCGHASVGFEDIVYYMENVCDVPTIRTESDPIRERGGKDYVPTDRRKEREEELYRIKYKQQMREDDEIRQRAYEEDWMEK